MIGTDMIDFLNEKTYQLEQKKLENNMLLYELGKTKAQVDVLLNIVANEKETKEKETKDGAK